MFIPLRILNPIKSGVAPGLILSMAASTAVLIATPLLLSELRQAFAVSAAAVGLTSAVQLGGFVITSFFAGRVATPSSRVFVFSIMVLSSANLASAAASDFWMLLLSRAVAGLALGALTWLAWAGVFGDAEGMSDVAVIGPIAGVIAAPMIGVMVDASSYRWAYIMLAVISLVPLVRIPEFSGPANKAPPRAKGGAPAAYAMVAALGVLTMGTSSVFIYAGLIASEELAISASTTSLLFAGNAAAGIPTARWRGKRPLAGLWLAVCGLCAVTIGVTSSKTVFAGAVIVWGSFFWLGVPGAFKILSERSRFPAERAGDAQAAMALGRIVGPLFGGALVSTGSFATLGLTGGGVVIAAGLVMLFVQYGVSAASLASS